MFGIGVVIPSKNNASARTRGSVTRPRILRFIKRNSMEQGKENNNYRKSCIVEIYCSGLKTVMLDIIKIKKIGYIVKELALKVVNYNIMMGITLDCVHYFL